MKDRKCLIATEGNIYTNGEIYGLQILLAEGVDADAFYEISIAEYEELQKATEEEYF